MITITVPVLPLVVAIAMLIASVFMLSETGGFGLAGGFIPLIAAAGSFFMTNGICSMFG